MILLIISLCGRNLRPKWCLKLQEDLFHKLYCLALQLTWVGPRPLLCHGQCSRRFHLNRRWPNQAWCSVTTRVCHARLSFCTCSILFHHCISLSLHVYCYAQQVVLESLGYPNVFVECRYEQNTERAREKTTHWWLLHSVALIAMWCNY